MVHRRSGSFCLSGELDFIITNETFSSSVMVLSTLKYVLSIKIVVLDVLGECLLGVPCSLFTFNLSVCVLWTRGWHPF